MRYSRSLGFLVLMLCHFGLASGNATTPFHGGDYSYSILSSSTDAILQDLLVQKALSFEPFGFKVNGDTAVVLYYKPVSPRCGDFQVIGEDETSMAARIASLLGTVSPTHLPVDFSATWGTYLVTTQSGSSPLIYDSTRVNERGVVYGQGIEKFRANLAKNVGPRIIPFGIEESAGTFITVTVPCVGDRLREWDVLEFPTLEDLEIPPGWLPHGCAVTADKIYLLVVSLNE